MLPNLNTSLNMRSISNTPNTNKAVLRQYRTLDRLQDSPFGVRAIIPDTGKRGMMLFMIKKASKSNRKKLTKIL